MSLSRIAATCAPRSHGRPYARARPPTRSTPRVARALVAVAALCCLVAVGAAAQELPTEGAAAQDSAADAWTRQAPILLEPAPRGDAPAAPVSREGLPDGPVLQGPAAPWHVIDTRYFRVHYPKPFEAWTLRLASRLDAIRDALVREVGYQPRRVVDVVIMDPEASANGYAIPLLPSPRMVLWATPPPADSLLGHYADWGELLAAHEDAHLVQLLRPSRNPLVRLIERTLLPVGPITTAAPRWVIEGYATLLEGELTGAGRPSSDLRAAILRRWAQQGRLPSYGALSGAPDRWLGGSMAYLAGSAYLEWLRARSGPDSLRHLWARMTARTTRTFEAAFAGVFGGSPDALYGRFVAELARDAMRLEGLVEPRRQDGVLWQRYEWSTGPPAVAPDGRQLAVVVRGRDRPARLLVLETGPDREGEQERQERIARMLARDPADVPPVTIAPPPRQPRYVLPTIDGAAPHWPRWMPDGRSLLFVRLEPDRDGFLHPDLFRWHLEGRVERITRGASLHRFDPAPDGTWAVAVRQRAGGSQLVRVDLASGAIHPITPAAVDVVYDGPRISPDGQSLVFLRNEGQGWRAVVRDVPSGAERELPLPARTTIATPAWAPDGATVYVSVGHSGFIDIVAVPVDGAGVPRMITQTHGAALAPAPSPDGSLYFLSLESHGFDLRHLEPVREAPVRVSVPEHLIGVVPAAASPPPEYAASPVSAGTPVRVGRQEWMPLAGGAAAPSARGFEAGVRGGDLLGRLNYFGVASIAIRERGSAGGTVAAAWRGWAPVSIHSQLFRVREAPSRQPVPAAAAGTAFDVTRAGLEAQVVWQRRGRPTDLRLSGGLLVSAVEPADSPRRSQTMASLGGAYSTRRSRDRWSLVHGVRLRGDVARTGDDPWQRLAFAVEAGAGYGSQLVLGTLERRAVFGTPAPFDRLLVGGMPSTVLPGAVMAGRRLAPPLPLGALAGDEHRAFRLELRRRGGPGLHYERHQMRMRGGAWGEAVAWLGAEFHVGGGPFPLLRLPGVEARAGVARLMDAPAGARVRWWVGLRWFV